MNTSMIKNKLSTIYSLLCQLDLTSNPTNVRNLYYIQTELSNIVGVLERDELANAVQGEAIKTEQEEG